tara:strand:+ start:521 stop:886 length:366 start_codon:yes stop_codon:yes gene_type:complete
MKFLVIDDDELVRTMICSVLRNRKCTVYEAVNGEEGVKLAKEHSPNFVITDMLMPDKEGIQTIIEIKALNPDIKIIAMSGGGEKKNMTFLEMAKKVGAHKLLKKPFKPSELFETIKELLDK